MPAERAKYANQPGRKKFARPVELVRASRSRFEERRPQCPSCGQRCPPTGHEDRDEWLVPYGHRRKVDLEPCPGWLAAPSAPPPPLPAKPAPPFPTALTGRPTHQLLLFPIPQSNSAPPPKRRRVKVTCQPHVSKVPPMIALFDVLAGNERADTQACER